MSNVTASVLIDHPAQVVWDYIIHPDNIANVLPGIVSVDARSLHMFLEICGME
jgi:carbon monoxide dehydrogenase subunit G